MTSTLRPALVGIGLALVAGCGRQPAPAWSPDGRMLAFSFTDEHGDCGLAILDTSTGLVRDLAAAAGATRVRACFDPDGTRLLVMRERKGDGEGLELLRLSVDGGLLGEPVLLPGENGRAALAMIHPVLQAQNRWWFAWSDEEDGGRYFYRSFDPRSGELPEEEWPSRCVVAQGPAGCFLVEDPFQQDRFSIERFDLATKARTALTSIDWPALDADRERTASLTLLAVGASHLAVAMGDLPSEGAQEEPHYGAWVVDARDGTRAWHELGRADFVGDVAFAEQDRCLVAVVSIGREVRLRVLPLDGASEVSALVFREDRALEQGSELLLLSVGMSVSPDGRIAAVSVVREERMPAHADLFLFELVPELREVGRYRAPSAAIQPARSTKR